MLETILQPDDTVERCGLVLKDGSIVEIKNIAEDPAVAYEMDPVELLPHVEADNIEIMWHTHPISDPVLSGADREGFLWWPDLVHCIIGRRDSRVAVERYRVEDGFVLACS